MTQFPTTTPATTAVPYDTDLVPQPWQADPAAGNGYADGGSSVPAEGMIRGDDGSIFLPRSKLLPLPFLIPFTIALMSATMGGVMFLTDLSFIVLIMLCGGCIVRELIVFPQRFGVGGLIAFGGTLIWFCYDYATHWMGKSVTNMEFEPWVFAKSAVYHMLFVFLMVVGLSIKRGRWLVRVLQAVPEPSNRNVYFLLVLATFVIGMIPFAFFSQENFFVTIYKSMFAGRSGMGAAFTAGRVGNVNYSWGGYVSQLADIGMMGAVLAAFHAIIVSQSVVQKVVCWGIWALWLMISFGTGTRGFVIFVGLPVMMLLFLKFNFVAAAAFRRLSFKAYAASAVLALAFLVLTQVQGQFRNKGFFEVGAGEVDAKLRGNEMYTTTLVGMQLIPNNTPHLANRYPGEGLIRAIPESIFWFCVGPIPRAMWNAKPIDPVGAWYSDTVTGDKDGVAGTTISGGAVGTWYFKFGPWGVVQIGLLYGWFMGTVERSLRTTGGRPMAILFTLAFATFLFRAFRDLWWHNLYPVIIGGVVMFIFVKTFNMLFGGGGEPQQQQQGVGGGGAAQPAASY
jgi:hypothetical protein